jgi:hypothetical protein
MTRLNQASISIIVLSVASFSGCKAHLKAIPARTEKAAKVDFPASASQSPAIPSVEKPRSIGGAAYVASSSLVAGTSELRWPALIYPVLDFVECQVDWDQNCTHLENLTAPAGLQACNVYWTITTQVPEGGHEWPTEGAFALVDAFPADYFPNDTEKPARFRTFRLYVTAHGTGNWLRRAGAGITLKTIGITVLDASATNVDRRREGCRL